MSVKQINSLIYASTLSNDDLNEIIEAIKYKRSQMSRLAKASMFVGDTVSFTSSKTGRTMVGTVKKIAIKYVTVDTGAGLWRVPANMLKVAETA
jgi:ribosomal protein L35AE/L33A